MSTDIKNHHPKARLCHIKKWDNFDGYGFNLHAEKGKPGQYIGKVDENSPAEAAGLRQGDRILEVNGENILNKSHKQVVELIKASPGETKLLVIDPHDEANNGIPITTSTTTTPPTETKNGTQEKKEHNHQQQQQQQPQQQQQQENGTLNLSMTAAELRAKLASKKKFDPKKESMDFKQKFDIVQKL